MNINEIINPSRPTSEIINDLKVKVIDIPNWEDLDKDYDPKQHKIANDPERSPKVTDDGVETPSTIVLPLEKLLVKRINEYTFAIPVKRVYSNVDDNDVRKKIKYAIESIYKHARIDAVNTRRGTSYYASCEAFTLWYLVPNKNSLYGFESNYKVKCKVLSPMDGVELYPLFDENDDMIAMSYQYSKAIGDEEYEYFETFTADKHYSWERKAEDTEWTERVESKETKINKIPGVYFWRPKPVYDELQGIRSDIEYTLSRNSDTIAYHSSPALKVSGMIEGKNKKNNSNRIIRVEKGGDVSYVSWSQSVDASKYHVDTLMRMYFMMSQMPDVSFENMIRLGNIGYDARKTLFTDAFLRIGDEAGILVEGLEREANVIKAILVKLNESFASEIDNVDIEHIITPYIQEDEDATISRWMKANGGKPLISHKESIESAGLTANSEDTFSQLQEEEAQEIEKRIESMFSQN